MKTNAGIEKLPLRMLSRVYGLVTTLRNYLYDRRLLRVSESGLPVISVGNVTAGGNSKTPLCMYIAAELHKRGLKPVILSRGYGGRLKGPRLVDAADDPQDVGDEPLLMTRTLPVPVVIARDRVAGAKLIGENIPGDLIILDDGFQHRRLGRCLDIVSVDTGTVQAIENFLAGRLLPHGLFREERERGLRRAGMLVFSERKLCRELPALDRRLLDIVPPGVPVFRSRLKSAGVHALRDGSRLEPCEAVAFCGLAGPENFFESLRQEGFRLREAIAFPDHFSFAADDLAALRERFPDLPLICTEKDSIKIRTENARGIYHLRVELSIEPDGMIERICSACAR